MRDEDALVMNILTADFRDTSCPEDAALVLVDPPYGIGKTYADVKETQPFAEWVNALVQWSEAPWTLIFGPHPTMSEWLHCIRPPKRIIYWHRTFCLPRRGLKSWTESLTPILVYQRDNAPWYGLTGSQRTQHDCIDAHSSMGDVGRIASLRRKGLIGEWPKHPAMTGTQIASKIIPLLTPEDGLVIDPMCGFGSILVAAQRLGRRIWGSEIEERYATAAQEWLNAEIKLAEKQ